MISQYNHEGTMAEDQREDFRCLWKLVSQNILTFTWKILPTFYFTANFPICGYNWKEVPNSTTLMSLQDFLCGSWREKGLLQESIFDSYSDSGTWPWFILILHWGTVVTVQTKVTFYSFSKTWLNHVKSISKASYTR